MEKINCHVIYVLKLEDDCWYVGWTTSFSFKKRMKDHWESPTKGAVWTRLHKPVRFYSIDNYDRAIPEPQMALIEDKKTLELASRYGFESVRGGGYCQRLPAWPMPEGKKSKQKKEERRPNQQAGKSYRQSQPGAKSLD